MMATKRPALRVGKSEKINLMNANYTLKLFFQLAILKTASFQAA